MPIRQIVTETLRQRVLLPRGRRVLAAVSGGSDSVALAWILKDLHDRGALVLAGIGHVHHQLRGGDADADEQFCRDLAARLGVPFFSGRVDVAAAVAAVGGSVESTARRLRYAWLEAAAERAGATYVATGHTLDDQAETVLLRLLRGAGGRGLSGIRPVRGVIIRPLLDCRRAQLRDYLATLGETFRDDISNTDLSIPRNRVRHELLPVIDRIAPGGLDALARAAMLSADDEKYLAQTAIDAARTDVLCSEADSNGPDLSIAGLGRLAPAIARRVVRDAIERAAPELAGQISAAHVDAARHLAAAAKGHLDLAGVVAECDGRVLRFLPAGHAVGAAEFTYQLAGPGAVTVSEANLVISAVERDQSESRGVETNTSRTTLELTVDAGALKWPLAVRNRRPGDRIKPTGGLGRKKVQDLLVDMKMPRAERDRVVVVVDRDGQLLWVVGVTPADECRVRTAPSAASSSVAEMVVLRAKRL